MTTPTATIPTDLTITENVEATKTYRLSTDSIQGYVDNLEALEQAIYKELNTERYENPIYGFVYGIELESLLGKDQTYVQVELKRRIRECLLRDERIENVDNFSFTVSGDKILCEFDVTSIYGELKITKEVNA